MKDENPRVRSEAAMALGRLGATDPQTLETLRKALKDENPGVRDQVFNVLWEISERTGVWIPPEGRVESP